MKRLKLKKVIASLLVAASILTLNPIGASAEWRQSSGENWWYAEGNSWATSNFNTSCLRSTPGGLCEGRMTEFVNKW